MKKSIFNTLSIFIVTLTFFNNSAKADSLQPKEPVELINQNVTTIATNTTNQSNSGNITILSSPRATVGQAKEWAKSNNATEVFINEADIFWNVCKEVGVDPVVAYTQSAFETGFGKFGGVLDESFHNPCGLKNKNNGSNYSKNAHQRFSSWDEGIKAQVDHLALYAGAPGYPKESTTDPRHFSFLAGTAQTVEDLGGKWAPSSTYGDHLMKMMNELEVTNAIFDSQKDATNEKKTSNNTIKRKSFLEYWESN